MPVPVFLPGCRPILIGSLPVSNHAEAVDWVLAHTPEIPVWPQLPVHPREGMMRQFLSGMPGLTVSNGRVFIDTDAPGFDAETIAFFETVLAEADSPPADFQVSAFALTEDEAPGLFALHEAIASRNLPLFAVKGQVTGPFTQATAVKDQNGQALFYNLQLRDAVTRLIAARARWQVRFFSDLGVPVLIFIDEPGLAGFGSSAFISITREDVTACLCEVIDAVHEVGGIAGIHICGNTDWGMVMDTGVDLVNFDAFTYFDRFILYPDAIRRFLAAGGLLGWGIVPTFDPADIDAATVDNLAALLFQQLDRTASLGIDWKRIRDQSAITPACGLSSRTPAEARKVLALTRDLAHRLRST